MLGASALHGGHHDAKKFKYTGLPRNDAEASTPPFESGSLQGGAGTPVDVEATSPALAAAELAAVDLFPEPHPARARAVSKAIAAYEGLVIAGRFARTGFQTLASARNTALPEGGVGDGR